VVPSYQGKCWPGCKYSNRSNTMVKITTEHKSKSVNKGNNKITELRTINQNQWMWLGMFRKNQTILLKLEEKLDNARNEQHDYAFAFTCVHGCLIVINYMYFDNKLFLRIWKAILQNGH
jgi:hypothetical protein